MVIQPSMGHTLIATRKDGRRVRLSEPGQKFSTVAPMLARLQREVVAGDSPFRSFRVVDDGEIGPVEPCPCIFPSTAQRWRTLAHLGLAIAEVIGIKEEETGAGFEFEGMRMGFAGLASMFIRKGYARRTPGGYEVIRLICEE